MQITPEGLLAEFYHYLYWKEDGEPKYGGGYVPKGERSQYYYDIYHDYISKLENGVYSFRIQVDDSPEGDTWESGKFVLEHGRVKIIEHQSQFTG